MTARQLQLLRETFDRVESHGQVASLSFFQRLFELDPSLRRLFHTDIEVLGRKVIGTLGFIVGSFDSPHTQRAALQALARRHVGYGVQERHYLTVGRALTWMLERELGTEFTPAVREAWDEAYERISRTMKEAGREMSATLPEMHLPGCDSQGR